MLLLTSVLELKDQIKPLSYMKFSTKQLSLSQLEAACRTVAWKIRWVLTLISVMILTQLTINQQK